MMQLSILDQVKHAALCMQRNNWEQGVLAQAFWEAGDRDTATRLAVEAVHRQQEDGRCCQIGGSTASTDPCAIGEALIGAARETGDPWLAQASEKLLRWAVELAPRDANGIVYHFDDSREIWVDSCYMLPPFLAAAGCYEEALRQMDGYWRILLDERKNLLSHRWDDATRTYPRRDVWGVGNGWAAAGMIRVRALLPAGYEAQKQLLESRIRTLLDAAFHYQREDGAFHDVLDDPVSFREINCGQMFAYTVYRGVAEGWLEERYLPYAEKSREAALASVNRYGLVQGVCGLPFFDHPGVAAEGQAFFILMEAARNMWKSVAAAD
ncbi:MAG: glycosyl hydrolase [Clostridiales bacterium]|nr:glycosyl hydrolase [Clostridiales bacterium]